MLIQLLLMWNGFLRLTNFASEVEPEDLFGSRYSRKGKEDVINQYLGNTYIEEALT